jgi:hypothetical protein
MSTRLGSCHIVEPLIKPAIFAVRILNDAACCTVGLSRYIISTTLANVHCMYSLRVADRTKLKLAHPSHPLDCGKDLQATSLLQSLTSFSRLFVWTIFCQLCLEFSSCQTLLQLLINIAIPAISL